MPRSGFVALAFLALGLTVAVGCSSKASSVSAATPAVPYAVLNDQAEPLRSDFNRDTGQVRLVFLMDPRCPTCLLGLSNIDRNLRASVPGAAKVKIYVVHESVIGGKPKDIPGAAGLLHHGGVHHYWSETGNIGRQVSTALDLRRGDHPVYAWDVWMIYGPEAVWKDAPPKPRVMMHQLSALDGDPRFRHLDSKAFVKDVATVLGQQAKAGGR
jgi:hypothetical protein